MHSEPQHKQEQHPPPIDLPPPPQLEKPIYLPPSPPFNVYARYAKFETLLNVSYWLWRLNPSATFPAMIGGAVDVVKQSAIILVLVVTISQLASAGILELIADAIKSGDTFAILRAISSSQLLTSIIWAVSVSVALYYFFSVLGGGFVNSAEYGSYLKLVRTGKISVSDVLENSGRMWHEMAWTTMVTEAVKYGPLVLTLAWIFSSIIGNSALGSANSLSDILLWLGAFAMAGIVTIALTAITIYAYPAAANGKFGFSAIKESIRICRAFPGKTVLYLLLRASSLAAVMAVSYVSSLFSVQISSIVAAFASFMVVPILHTLKTAIYVRGEPQEVIIPIPVGPSIVRDAPGHIWRSSVAKIRIGMRELAEFVFSPRNIPYHLLSAATFVAGILEGKQVSSSGLGKLIGALGYEAGRVNPAFRGFALPFMAVDISFHNWQVSMATAISGLALAVPILVTMMFNGFVLGVVGSIVPSFEMLLAAILPHGIVELPSFVVSGSVGLSLAAKFLKALRKGGASSQAEVHRATRRAIYAVLCLVPFFMLAGALEALVTPFVMRFFGWK